MARHPCTIGGWGKDPLKSVEYYPRLCVAVLDTIAGAG
jgi:hypothetical protein